MTDLLSQSNPKGWHFARWSELAWLETIVKSSALTAGVFALIDASANGVFIFPSESALALAIILFILSLGLVFAVFDRLQRMEITSMVFVIFNNLGHWSLLSALFFTPFPVTYLLLFSGLMLVGDFIKLLEIFTGSLQLPGVSQTTLYGLTAFYTFGYITIFLITLFSV